MASVFLFTVTNSCGFWDPADARKVPPNVDERVKKIIDIRYNTTNNKLVPWRVVAEKLDMSIQGCINIHNKFIKKVRNELNKNYV